MGLTTDRNDPCLDIIEEDGMQKCYLILSDEERAKGFVRPVYHSYKHVVCGKVTRMGLALCETYAAKPSFYGGTFCVSCGAHYDLVKNGVRQFIWMDANGYEAELMVGE